MRPKKPDLLPLATRFVVESTTQYRLLRDFYDMALPDGKNMTAKRFCILMTLIPLTAIFGACSDDDILPTPPPSPPATDEIFPGTEDQLLENFRAAYEDRDNTSLQKVLQSDFVTFLQMQTQAEFPEVGPTLDLSEELRIAQRIFSGQHHTGGSGNLVPGISTISFQTFTRRDPWSTSPASGALPNTRFAFFDVAIHFDRPGYSTLRSEGQIKFTVAGRDSVHNGVLRTYWQMVGQQDLTHMSLKAVEEVAWGSLKALYW